MTEVNASLQELRDLVQKPADRKVWDAICAELDKFEDEEGLQMALDYVAEHTKGWKRHFRQAPQSWLKQALAGEDQPRLKVVADARFSGRLSEEQLRNLGECPHLGAMQALSMRQCGLWSWAGAIIGGYTNMPSLTHLDLYYNEIDGDGLADLIDGPLVEQLVYLDIDLNSFGESEFPSKLASTTRLGKLEDLKLYATGHWGVADDLEFIAMNKALHPRVKSKLASYIEEARYWEESEG